MDLILHQTQTLWDALRYCKLIGPNDDEDSLQTYANSLLKTFILEQQQYFPNSSKICGDWIVTASHLFESIIIKNEIPITDMPPTHQTALNEFKDEEVLRIWSSMDENFLSASFREIDECVELYHIPNKEAINQCSREIPLN